MIARTLSLLLALGYVLFAFLAGEVQAALGMSGFLLVPLGCIWYPDVVGEWTGTVGFHHVSSASPEILVKILGWFLLLLPVLLTMVIALRSP